MIKTNFVQESFKNIYTDIINAAIDETSKQRGKVISKNCTYKLETKKIGRNELCHCGSGKKYKYCCGK